MSLQSSETRDDIVALVKATVHTQRTSPDFAEFAIGNVGNASLRFLYSQSMSSFQRHLYVQELIRSEESAHSQVAAACDRSSGQHNNNHDSCSGAAVLASPVRVPPALTVGPHAAYPLGAEEHEALVSHLCVCDTAERLEAAVGFMFRRPTRTECVLATAGLLVNVGELSAAQTANIFYAVSTLLYEHQTKGRQPMPYLLVFCVHVPRILRGVVMGSRRPRSELLELAAVVQTWEQSGVFPLGVHNELVAIIAEAPSLP